MCARHRTAHTSRIQNLALHVGQGTLLDNHVSGVCSSRRLANHRPRHNRHHMGLQWHCWQSESSSSVSVTDSNHTGVVTRAYMNPPKKNNQRSFTCFVAKHDQFGVCWNLHAADTGLYLLCTHTAHASDSSHLSTGHNLMNAAKCTCPRGRTYGWLRSTWALNVSKKSSLSVWWITTLGEFLMGARSFSRSSAYSVELSLERVGKMIWFLVVLTRDVQFCRDNTYLILNGVTAGLMLSTLSVRISVGEAESGFRWCCVDSVTVTWQSLCRAM